MSAERRKSPLLPDESHDDPGYVPRPDVPQLPRAFVGRRRFSLRSDEPEAPAEDDPISRARAWAEQDFDESSSWVEKAPAPDTASLDAEPATPESSQPILGSSALLGESGMVVDDGFESFHPDVHHSDAVWSGTARTEDRWVSPLPRLPVAGARDDESGPQLPPPPDEDWPSETPPELDPFAPAPDEADHARGAAESLAGGPQPGVEGYPQAQPRPAEPRPSVHLAGRFPLPERPGGPNDGPRTPLTLQPVPSPLRHERSVETPPSDPPAIARSVSPEGPVAHGAETAEPFRENAPPSDPVLPQRDSARLTPQRTAHPSSSERPAMPRRAAPSARPAPSRQLGPGGSQGAPLRPALTGRPAPTRQAAPSAQPAQPASLRWRSPTSTDAPEEYDRELEPSFGPVAWAERPPSLGPSTTGLAALGCLVAFVVLVTIGAVGIAIAFTWG